MSSIYLQNKVLGGLIAKQVARRLGQLPEKATAEQLDQAARDVLADGHEHPGSVETAKQEAARLLAKARQMGSLSAAMDAYKREMRQLHEAEKAGGSLYRQSRRQATMIQAGVVAGNLAAVLVVSIYMEVGAFLMALMWLPSVYILLICRKTRLHWPALDAWRRRLTAKRA